MRVLVTGSNGQLGFDVCRELKSNNIEYFAHTSEIADITNEAVVSRIIYEYNPSVIIHCAAYTAVDKAETNKEECFDVNVNGTSYIAKACKKIGAKLLYISSDYVFNGEGINFYDETTEPSPVNWYGFTKYMGEKTISETLSDYFILRISWVFGEQGNNFVKTMIDLGKSKSSINVVSDQVGSPTSTADLSKLICEMIQTNEYGLYHVTNEGTCSWAEFSEYIFQCANIPCSVNYIMTSEYPTKAKRPLNSRMSKEKLNKSGFTSLPHWKISVSSLIEMLENSKPR